MPRKPSAVKSRNLKSYGVRSRNDSSWKRKHIAKKTNETIEEQGAFGAYSRVEDELDIHRALVRYWFIKNYDPIFHNKGVGGYRYSRFQPWEKPVV